MCILNLMVFQLSLYEVTQPLRDPLDPGSYRLLSRRPVTSYGSGWEVFNVTDIIRHWSTNVTATHGKG